MPALPATRKRYAQGLANAVVSIELIGQYMAGNFPCPTDGGVGTLVTDRPTSAPTDQRSLTLVNTQH